MTSLPLKSLPKYEKSSASAVHRFDLSPFLTLWSLNPVALNSKSTIKCNKRSS